MTLGRLGLNCRTLTTISALCMSLAGCGGGGQNLNQLSVQGPVYNPYPPGILPADLESEIARVLREIDGIEAQAIAQWKALPPPMVSANPPTPQNSGTAAMETLGKLLNFDKNMSPFQNVACSS